MDVTLATGVILIDFLNKSLETLKLVQKDKPDSLELQLHLATLTQQLSLTMVEASQLQGILAQKNEEIRQLKTKLSERDLIKYDSKSEMYWSEGDDSPFCTKCYENDEKYIHLSFTPEQPSEYLDGMHFPGSDAYYSCKACSSVYTKVDRTN
ncbi:hypothetical protein ACN1SX_003512 [Vibrio cholerae]